MHSTNTLTYKRIRNTTSKLQCEAHSDLFKHGEALDEQYKYLHKLYYDLLAQHNATKGTHCSDRTLCQLQALENEMAQILLEFDAPAELYE